MTIVATAIFGTTALLPEPELTACQPTDLALTNNTAISGITVKRNGDIVIVGDNGETRTNEWLLSGDKSSTVGDDYEVALWVTGDTPSGPSVTNGVWHTISSDQVWTLTNSTNGTTLSCSGTIEIRQENATSNTSGQQTASFSSQVL